MSVDAARVGAWATNFIIILSLRQAVTALRTAQSPPHGWGDNPWRKPRRFS
jgi:hypothetical protein